MDERNIFGFRLLLSLLGEKGENVEEPEKCETGINLFMRYVLSMNQMWFSQAAPNETESL